MFRRKERLTTLEDIANFEVVCPRCNNAVSFEGKHPLSVVVCSRCNKGHVFTPLQIGHFWLFKPLGGGGMGAVYEAFIEGSDELAAVKILPADQSQNPQLIQNLQQECRIMQEIGQHTCLTSYIDSGYLDREHYLATQYIEGERLDHRIERTKGIPENEVINIGLQLIQGLCHIYNHGYLYRDLKPQNIIINEDDKTYLFDFGICMSIVETYCDDSDVVQGSPLYISPERMVGEAEKVYSEIYSLGMVLYHCLKGKPYYEAKELATLTRKHARKLRLSNEDVKMSDISPELTNVLSKMIKRKAKERYQNYFEVENDLMQILVSRL